MDERLSDRHISLKNIKPSFTLNPILPYPINGELDGVLPIMI